MKLLLSLIMSLLIISCKNTGVCKDDSFLLGRWKIDTILLRVWNSDDPTILPMAKSNNWDEIVLVAEKNKYYFEGCEEYFRKYEGTWEYKEMGWEGDCYMYIDQKKGTPRSPTDPFTIAIRENNKLILLPFTKKVE